MLKLSRKVDKESQNDDIATKMIDERYRCELSK